MVVICLSADYQEYYNYYNNYSRKVSVHSENAAKTHVPHMSSRPGYLCIQKEREMSGYIFKLDLATAYFPTVSPRSALRLLRRELRHNQALWDELSRAGYHPTQQRFTPLQVCIIYRYIGEP